MRHLPLLALLLAGVSVSQAWAQGPRLGPRRFPPRRVPPEPLSGPSAVSVVTSPTVALPSGPGLPLDVRRVEWTNDVAHDAFLIAYPPRVTNALGALRVALAVPPLAPDDVRVLVHVKDSENFWFQNLLPDAPRAGASSDLTVDLSPQASGWKPVGHYGTWNLLSAIGIRELGLRVYSQQDFTGRCEVLSVTAMSLPEDDRPPAFENVRPDREPVPCYEKFEVVFDLPDRYTNPFDTNQVTVWAVFTAPNGSALEVPAFYTREFYRRDEPVGERLVPQGAPTWRVRFAPLVEGEYSFRLAARDSRGAATWGPGAFTAVRALSPGFVRVSRRDPRYFEFTSGEPFFPIGHNIRSPSDSRFDERFPWRKRWLKDNTSYAQYFRRMHENGENMVEIWLAAWSLALEWTAAWTGYHGVGRYNLMNAWEMDRVLEGLEQHGIYLNLVIHNHGKFSTFSDAEWGLNPFNERNGGYLAAPEEFFTDPRAREHFLQMMRYVVARWGYSHHVFAWELWSELNLTGSRSGTWKDPAVREWHQSMGRAIKDIDPYDHMISTHVSGNYSIQDPELVRLPEMDLGPMDAYHGSRDPLHIVQLLRESANYNNGFGKPALVTEFGGAAQAASLHHLERTLHAALWSSACMPLGGTPLFWWWELIDERDLYVLFRPVAAFTKGEDRRRPLAVPFTPRLESGGAAVADAAVVCLRDREWGLGWIHRVSQFAAIDPAGPPTVSRAVLAMDGMSRGFFDVEFWDTLKGTVIVSRTVEDEEGVLRIPVPPFARDVAFKIRRQKP